MNVFSAAMTGALLRRFLLAVRYLRTVAALHRILTGTSGSVCQNSHLLLVGYLDR